MSRGKAAPRTPPLEPDVHDLAVRKELAALVDRIVDFGQLVADHAGDRLRHHPDALVALVEQTRFLFQKWNLEMLYLLALFPKLRFGELQRSLPGISSRTLSLKLADLETAGFVVRTVLPGRPLRIEYSLARPGRVAGRLAIPLVMVLGGYANEPPRRNEPAASTAAALPRAKA